MFDVGFSELLLLAVVALVVLGPEKLPHAARMTGAWIGRIRRMVLGIQAEIEKEVAAQEMRDRIQKEVERLKSTEVAINQELRGVENTIHQSLNEAPAPLTATTDTHLPPIEPETPAAAMPESNAPSSEAATVSDPVTSPDKQPVAP